MDRRTFEMAPGVQRHSARPPSLRVSLTLVRKAAKAGASPQTMPVSTESRDCEQHHRPVEPDSLNTRQRFRQQAHAHSQRDSRQTHTEPALAEHRKGIGFGLSLP